MNFGIILILLFGALLLGVCLWPLAADLVRGRFDIFNPRNMFLGYLALQLAVYPIYLILSGKSFRYLDVYEADDARWMVLALLLSTFGVIAFRIGYWWSGTTGLFSWVRRPWGLNRGRVALVTAGLIPFAVFCNYSVYFSRGGFGGYMDSFVDVRYAGTGASGFMFYLATSFVSIVAVLTFMGSLGSRRPRTWWLVSGALFLCSALTTGLTGFRAALAPIFLMAGACYHYYVRRFHALGTVLFVGGIIAFMSIYGIVRGQVEATLSGIGTDTYGRVSMFDALLVRSPGIELAAITMRGVNEGQDYALFAPGLWEAATILVPRPLWADKPVPQSLVYGERFMSYFLFLRDGTVGAYTGGNSMTIVGYLYWQLGAVAVVGGMALLGAFFGWLYRYFMERKDNAAVAFSFIVFSSSMSKFAEAPQDTVNGLVIAALFVFLLVAFCGAPLAAPSRGALAARRGGTI